MANLLVILLFALIAYYASKAIWDGVLMGVFFSGVVLVIYLILNYVAYFDFGDLRIPRLFKEIDYVVESSIKEGSGYKYKKIDLEKALAYDNTDYSYLDRNALFRFDLEIDEEERIVLVDATVVKDVSLYDNINNLYRVWASTKNSIQDIGITLMGKEYPRAFVKDGRLCVSCESDIIAYDSPVYEYTLDLTNLRGDIKVVYATETRMGLWDRRDVLSDYTLKRVFPKEIGILIYQNNNLIYEKYPNSK